MINQTALAKIVHYLGLQSFQVSWVVRCEEWEHVYFVQMKGHRPTFYSKKMVDRAQSIKNGYLVGGDWLIVDQKTNSTYIVRKPGFETYQYGFKKLSGIPSPYATFDGCQRYEQKFSYRLDMNQKNPKNLRDLYIHLAIARHDQIMELMGA